MTPEAPPPRRPRRFAFGTRTPVAVFALLALTAATAWPERTSSMEFSVTTELPGVVGQPWSEWEWIPGPWGPPEQLRFF